MGNNYSAVIDIGSNSVRLLIKGAQNVTPKTVITTRLASGLLPDGKLSRDKMDETLNAVKLLAKKAQEKTDKLYIFATAAVRKAINGREFVDEIFKLCAAQCDILSGEKEAEAGVFGALGLDDGTVIDIGGASTEVCFKRQGELKFIKSFDIGAVTLFKTCKNDRAAINNAINKIFLPHKAIAAKQQAGGGTELSLFDKNTLDGKSIGADNYYAVGGTATTLAAVMLGEYSPDTVHGFNIEYNKLKSLTDELFKMSIEEISALGGMDIKRADIIAGGASLLCAVMRALGAEYVTVSERDNMEGYLLLKEMGRI